MNFTHKAKILFIITLFLTNCAKVDPVTGEKILIETDPKEKAKKFVEQGGGIFGNITKGGLGGQAVPSFANSNVLWRASLKSLEFLPLVNTDYTGGIIIYDWYAQESNSQEQIKICLFFNVKFIKLLHYCNIDISYKIMLNYVRLYIYI